MGDGKLQGIEVTKNGVIIAEGKGITLFTLATLKGAVKLEAFGMKRRGESATSIARRTLGVTTRDRKELVKLLEEKILKLKEEMAR